MSEHERIALPARSYADLAPHDIAAEEAVIAAILLDENAIFDVMPVVQPADFYRERHRWCLEASIRLAERNEPIDFVTLANELDRVGRLDAVGGEPWLVEITGKYFTAVGVEAHARIVARDATYRRLMTAGQQVIRLAYEGGPDLTGTLARARALVEGVESEGSMASVAHVGEVIASIQVDDTSSRVSTGYRAIDAITRGMAAGQVTVIGARTDNGKTALLAGMAFRQARAGVPIFYVPLEDSSEEVVARMASDALGRSWDAMAKLRANNAISAEAFEAFKLEWRQQVELLDLWPLHFPAGGRTPGTIDDLCASIATAVRRFGVRVAYLDHIDSLPKRRERGQSDASLYAEWMAALKSLAVRLGVHLVVASQVNREADRGGQNPPPMYLLKESSAKEQAAQTVLMVGLEPEEDVRDQRRVMLARVEKVKGLARSRDVAIPDGHVLVWALYQELPSGAIRELTDSRDTAA